MIYKFAQQLKAKLVELKSNEIVDLLADLNNTLLEKATVHKLEEQYQIKNQGLIKQIREYIRIYCYGYRLGRLFSIR